MRLECTADPRAWADVVDVWTRKMLREFSDTVATGDEEVIRAYYRRVVKSAHLCDVDGNEYDLDAILSIDNFDNVDAAVANWWGGLPFLAYQERQKMGEAKRVS